jgi:gamma-glutamylcysteine synthetase
MNTKTQVNGSVKTIENAVIEKQVKTAEPTASEKKEAFNAMLDKFKPKQPTADERIQRISHFEAVSKRFKVLKEKSNELKMFDAGNDQTNAKIILKNSGGFEFSVSNSNVIKKVRDTMEAELNILLADAENEILTFEI